jgi:hypothetical protein|tara:strand:+ start:24246 stop:24749 length:504 start_codon:yes stop_codon:yes gene_type:complete
MATQGKNSFLLFLDCLKENNFKHRKPTHAEKEEDIDLVIWDESDKSLVFALAIKKTLVKRSKKRKHVWGWVELKDKHGNEGWLYKQCTFIVYERKNDFVLIKKNDFRNWIQSNNIARWDLPFVGDSWSAANRLFRRKGTKEAICHVKISEAIKNCKHYIWEKPKTSE